MTAVAAIVSTIANAQNLTLPPMILLQEKVMEGLLRSEITLGESDHSKAQNFIDRIV